MVAGGVLRRPPATGRSSLKLRLSSGLERPEKAPGLRLLNLRLSAAGVGLLRDFGLGRSKS